MQITSGEPGDRLSIFDHEVFSGRDDAPEFNRWKHRRNDIETGDDLIAEEVV